MNAIYSIESQVRRDQFRPDFADLLVENFGSDPRLIGSESSRLRSPIEFEHDFEKEFAQTLDHHKITWQYKPRTFAVEWDADGNFIDSFTPSFFLPARDLYIELVSPECRFSSERARKARLLRQQHPAITIEVLPCAYPYQVVEQLC